MALNNQLYNAFKEWQNILPRLLLEKVLDHCDELKFEIRTREDSRHIPHIHVSTTIASLSIAIEDGKILEQSGKITSKNITKAQDWLTKHKDMLIKEWNNLPNVIKIAI